MSAKPRKNAILRCMLEFILQRGQVSLGVRANVMEVW